MDFEGHALFYKGFYTRINFKNKKDANEALEILNNVLQERDIEDAIKEMGGVCS